MKPPEPKCPHFPLLHQPIAVRTTTATIAEVKKTRHISWLFHLITETSKLINTKKQNNTYKQMSLEYLRILVPQILTFINILIHESTRNAHIKLQAWRNNYNKNFYADLNCMIKNGTALPRCNFFQCKQYTANRSSKSSRNSSCTSTGYLFKKSNECRMSTILRCITSIVK